MSKIYQQWIDIYKHKYNQTFKCEISDDLEAKYKQNTYSVIYIETRGSRQDWKDDDDEESESVKKETGEDGLSRLFYIIPATFYN